MKKILILHTSVGLGHKAIAYNFASRLRDQGFTVEVKDILQVEQSVLSRSMTKLYLAMVVRVPFVWKWLYTSSLVNYIGLPLRVPLASKYAANTRKLITEFEADCVITTQTTASAVMSHLKESGGYAGVWGIAFSDFHFHPFWVYPHADFYLTNIEEQGRELVAKGVPAAHIIRCGITLAKKQEFEKSVVKKKFGIPQECRVVLMGAGSLGFGLPEQLVLELATIPNTHVVLVCGKNQELENKLQKKYEQKVNITVFGFYTPMAELYTIADVYVSKPGGLSVAEALQYDVPLFITHSLPGQEQFNTTYLSDRGLVTPLEGSDAKQIVDVVRDELDSHTKKGFLMAHKERDILVGETVQDAWLSRFIELFGKQ